jgi:hypothetical protein
MKVSDIIEREHGSRNWVLHRRTARIVERYGEDVVCLSPKQFAEYEMQAELETADEHPAYPLLKKWMGNHCDAINTIKMLREAGFRIVPVSFREAGFPS